MSSDKENNQAAINQQGGNIERKKRGYGDGSNDESQPTPKKQATRCPQSLSQVPVEAIPPCEAIALTSSTSSSNQRSVPHPVLCQSDRVYNDAFSGIFSFLPFSDVLSAAATCRRWFIAAQHEPCRGLSVRPRYLPLLITSKLKHHVTHVGAAGSDHACFPEHVSMLHQLPSLRVLKMRIGPYYYDNTDSDIQEQQRLQWFKRIEALEYTVLTFPVHIRKLELRLQPNEHLVGPSRLRVIQDDCLAELVLRNDMMIEELDLWLGVNDSTNNFLRADDPGLDLSYLVRLQHLRRLRIHEPQPTLVQLRAIRSIPNLLHLECTAINAWTELQLHHLSDVAPLNGRRSTIQTLNLEHTTIRSSNIESIRRIDSLTKLDACSVFRSCIPSLGKMTALRELNVTIPTVDFDLDVALDVTPLHRLAHLTSLRLGCCVLDSDDLRELLSALPRLLSLSLFRLRRGLDELDWMEVAFTDRPNSSFPTKQKLRHLSMDMVEMDGVEFVQLLGRIHPPPPLVSLTLIRCCRLPDAYLDLLRPPSDLLPDLKLFNYTRSISGIM